MHVYIAIKGQYGFELAFAVWHSQLTCFADKIEKGDISRGIKL